MRVERALVGLCLLAAVSAGCSGGRLAYNLPPSPRLMHPGPGVDGPGPGVIPPAFGHGPGVYGPGVGRFGDAMMPGAAVGAVCATEGGPADHDVMHASYDAAYGDAYGYGGAYGGESFDGGCTVGCCGPPSGIGHGHGGPGLLHGLLRGAGGFHRGHGGVLHGFAGVGVLGMPMAPTSQIAFLGVEGIQISWDVSGVGMFDSVPLVVPGRQNFFQGAIYRLRVTNVPGRPGVVLYPTLEVAPVTPRTDAYLAHAPIPVQFTEEDFDQALAGNFVTKVIYLPDPEFQELALAGVETLVSTRLDPGVDPIAEADRRGSILAILRLGNKDLQGGVPGMVGVQPEFFEPGIIEPLSHEASAGHTTGGKQGQAQSAVYEQSAGGEMDAIEQAQYSHHGGHVVGHHGGHVVGHHGGYAVGHHGGYVDAAAANMPLGMPTAGMAPPVVPPHLVAGGGDWGMPISGTPIGLPGPPHIPHGSPAGLRRHVMHNRTREHIPPPVSKMGISVRQRPGMNYPRPVTRVHVEETQREPLKLWPFGNLFSGGVHGHHGGHH